MKKTLLFVLALSIVIPAFSQGISKHRIALPAKANLVLKKPYKPGIKEECNLMMQPKNSTVSSSLFPPETTIGMTRYDLQTNQSTQNRLYYYEDGTLGAVWTRGMAETSFADRGTGYNYFDGTAWGDEPTQRIESVKTGWPSYCPLGPDGEIVVSHTSYSGLSIAKRAQKNAGNWSESVLAGPVGAVDISWPRVVTTGPDHNKIHCLAATYATYLGQTTAVLYYRSLDGGNTWDKQHVVLPGMDVTNYKTFGGDCYAWAEPKGDTLAFVVGDNWVDLFMMKSTDGGENWTKTVIFQHPYPLFEETTTLVTDTPTVCDGSVNIVLDNQGKAHVFFGIMRVLNTDLSDQQTSFFPGTDGLGYWNEDMALMTNITYDTLSAHNMLVGYTQDINGNDTILEFDGIATYYLSVTSMPNATIDSEGRIYLCMTSVVEGLTTGSQNFRHIYGRVSFDGGTSWSDFTDFTGSVIHNFSECVFPTVAPKSNTHVPMIFQMDDEPGMALRGDEDSYGDNTIVYSSIPKTDFGVGVNQYDPVNLSVSSNYPNPARENTTVIVTVNKPSKLVLQLWDVSGRLIKSIDKGQCNSGTQYFTLDCRNLNNGMYLYTVTADGTTKTGKMIVQ